MQYCPIDTSHGSSEAGQSLLPDSLNGSWVLMPIHSLKTLVLNKLLTHLAAVRCIEIEALTHNLWVRLEQNTSFIKT